MMPARGSWRLSTPIQRPRSLACRRKRETTRVVKRPSTTVYRSASQTLPTSTSRRGSHADVTAPTPKLESTVRSEARDNKSGQATIDYGISLGEPDAAYEHEPPWEPR